jgi:hypothetical protein
MAIACFRLLTLPPLPPGPLFAVPRLKRRISFFYICARAAAVFSLGHDSTSNDRRYPPE